MRTVVAVLLLLRSCLPEQATPPGDEPVECIDDTMKPVPSYPPGTFGLWNVAPDAEWSFAPNGRAYRPSGNGGEGWAYCEPGTSRQTLSDGTSAEFRRCSCRSAEPTYDELVGCTTADSEWIEVGASGPFVVPADDDYAYAGGGWAVCTGAPDAEGRRTCRCVDVDPSLSAGTSGGGGRTSTRTRALVVAAVIATPDRFASDEHTFVNGARELVRFFRDADLLVARSWTQVIQYLERAAPQRYAQIVFVSHGGLDGPSIGHQQIGLNACAEPGVVDAYRRPTSGTVGFASALVFQLCVEETMARFAAAVRRVTRPGARMYFAGCQAGAATFLNDLGCLVPNVELLGMPQSVSSPRAVAGVIANERSPGTSASGYVRVTETHCGACEAAQTRVHPARPTCDPDDVSFDCVFEEGVLLMRHCNRRLCRWSDPFEVGSCGG